jgi:integrase
MSSIFNHAIRWEFTDRNPISGLTKGSGVRVSSKGERVPDILDVGEMQVLLGALGIREKAIVFFDMPPGLRRGELAGLKWEDFDFKNLQVSVTRSLVDQHVGPVKTETSRKLMPIDPFVARVLLAWRQITPYRQPSDYTGRPMQTVRAPTGETTRLAQRHHARLHSINRQTNRNYEEDFVAHVSPHFFLHPETKRPGHKSGVGADASCLVNDDAGHLHPGTVSRQTRRSEPGRGHDSAATRLYRRCTARFRRDLRNCLKELGVPDGI